MMKMNIHTHNASPTAENHIADSCCMQVHNINPLTTSRWLMDNAPARIAKASNAFLSSNDINACKVWPPNSPDLIPIQTVWAVMKQQVCSRHYNTLVELMAAVEKAWQSLSGSYLKTLMASFSCCKAKCLLAGGGCEGY